MDISGNLKNNVINSHVDAKLDFAKEAIRILNMNKNNPLSQRNSPESICLRAFLLALSERSTNIDIYAHHSDIHAQAERGAAATAAAQARKNGTISPRYLDLMAKVIQGMGYTGEEGHKILTFFRIVIVEEAKNNT